MSKVSFRWLDEKDLHSFISNLFQSLYILVSNKYLGILGRLLLQEIQTLSIFKFKGWWALTKLYPGIYKLPLPNIDDDQSKVLERNNTSRFLTGTI